MGRQIPGDHGRPEVRMMDSSPTIATLVVGVPLPRDEARASVLELFPNSDNVLSRSLFYRQITEIAGGPSTFFVSAHGDHNNFVLIVHFQQEDGETLSRFEIRVEPGLGVDIRKAADQVWDRLSHASQLSRAGARPKLYEAAISSGGADIVTGHILSTTHLMTNNSEFRLPILVGVMSVATLAVALPLRLVPLTQLPAAWWVVVQLVVPAVAAVAVAMVSNLRKGICWRIE